MFFYIIPEGKYKINAEPDREVPLCKQLHNPTFYAKLKKHSKERNHRYAAMD